MSILDELPSILSSSHSHGPPDLEPLEPIHFGFFVPRLDNKPQNPIIDTIELEDYSGRSSRPSPGVASIQTGQPLQGSVVVPNGQDALKISIPSNKTPVSDIWMTAAAGSDALGNNLKTWDSVRYSRTRDAERGDLLSEQDPSVFVAAQDFVIPHVHAPGSSRLHFPPAELMEILVTNLTGHSSRLYDWDSSTESFRQSKEYADRIILAYGFTEELSKSIISLYLAIGTSFRRLDSLIQDVRHRVLHPTMHAFLHSLEMIVESLRKQLARARIKQSSVFSRLWLQYADIKESLAALAELCNVDATASPPFKPIPDEPAALLTHIYTFTERHIASFSPRSIRASFAYLLSTASHPFLRTVEESIGIGSAKGLLVNPASSRKSAYAETDEFGFHEEDDVAVLNMDEAPPEYPSFFSAKLKSEVIQATRGLKVLTAADPNHPLLKDYTQRRCEWVWHEDRIEEICTGSKPEALINATLHLESRSHTEPDEEGDVEGVQYKPELANFRIFDMEPGSQWSRVDQDVTSLPIDTTPFQSFLATFPDELPLSTPSISLLADVVLMPLKVQSDRLLNALLERFLTPPLSLPSHFLLLHSFMLLGSQNFTMRLRGALFSDSDAYQPVGRGTRARTRARLGIMDDRDIAAEQEDLNRGQDGINAPAKWGIGLGVGLSERGIWPPGGTELGFALRRVIVDTLDEMKAEKHSGHDADSGDEEEAPKEEVDVIKEAEWRLGFAIRDLPIDEARQDWLNPSSLAALDFLYLDYKPPLPVAALITPVLLSKYQRLFNFLLRLLRADTVSRGLFWSIQKGGAGFNSAAATALLRRFRFHTHTFVSVLTSYVFDTVVRTNFDAFNLKLRTIEELHYMRQREWNQLNTARPGSSHQQEPPKPAADIFEVMGDHSKMLDKILGGCMLRTQQRAISDVVEDILSIILLLGSLVRDFKRHALSEEDATAQLQKLHTTFERKMMTLTKVLRAMDDKSELRSLLSALATSDRDYEVLTRNTGTKRDIGLSDLLVRMDPGEWWKRELERRTRAKRAKDATQIPDIG